MQSMSQERMIPMHNLPTESFNIRNGLIFAGASPSRKSLDQSLRSQMFQYFQDLKAQKGIRPNNLNEISPSPLQKQFPHGKTQNILFRRFEPHQQVSPFAIVQPTLPMCLSLKKTDHQENCETPKIRRNFLTQLKQKLLDMSEEIRKSKSSEVAITPSPTLSIIDSSGPSLKGKRKKNKTSLKNKGYKKEVLCHLINGKLIYESSSPFTTKSP